MVETKPDGEVVARLLDFGLAAEIRSSMGRVSSDIHDTSGTRPFMAPEQWAGRKQGPATDQYALAVLLYEMLTGEVPFASAFETGDPMVMMNAVCNREVEFPEDCPRKKALCRALAKDQSQRFASCVEFIETAAKSEPAPKGGIKASRDAEEKHGRRGVRAALCIAAIAIGLVSIGGWWWKSGREARSTGVIRVSPIAEVRAETEREREEAATKAKAEQEKREREAAEARAKAEREREEAAAKARDEQYKRELEEAEVTERDREEAAVNPTAQKTKTISLPGGATMEMIYVAPGSFIMGSPESEKGRENYETQHRVTLTKGFWLGKYEVTQKQWKSVMGESYSFSDFKGDNRPVDNVSWYDCKKFIKRVNWQGRNYDARLPSEAEWEYACRAGSTGAYGGNGKLDDMGWYDGNSGKETHPVGQKSANGWGFHDMHGNVREWCNDWFDYYDNGSTNDPQGPAKGILSELCGNPRVLRGGGCGNSARDCRSASRDGYDPGFHFGGFRLCCPAE